MAFAHSETPEHVRTTIGAVLRRRREAAERSLLDIARPAGISPAYLSEVERGRKEISVERLLKLCLALETTIGEIYFELARELGAGEPLNAVAWEADPRIQLRRMMKSLDVETLRTVAHFTSFLSTEGAGKRRQIGFMR